MAPRITFEKKLEIGKRVFSLIEQGLTYDQIASTYGISKPTVSLYLKLYVEHYRLLMPVYKKPRNIFERIDKETISLNGLICHIFKESENCWYVETEQGTGLIKKATKRFASPPRFRNETSAVANLVMGWKEG